MSGLWTPSGEHVPGREEPTSPSDASAVPDEAALAEELRRVREEIAGTPVADIVANHAVGLWQLAVLHLTPETDETPRLEEAALAIDAMAAIVETLGERLGRHAEPLQDALTQLRLAFVEVRNRGDGGNGDDSDR